MSAPVWPAKQLRHLSQIAITNGLGESGDSSNPEEWPRYIRTTDIKSLFELHDDRRVTLPERKAADAPVKLGDILMTAAGATVGKSSQYSETHPACYAGYLVRWRVDERTAVPRFMAYWTESQHFWDQIAIGNVKSTIENFSASKYRSMRAPVPPINVQRSIADYLDRETQQIDELLAEQRGLIETLRERRIGVISQGVARGIDNEQLGEASIPWLGPIPAGWVPGRIKHLGAVTLGKMLQSRGNEGDVKAPYMRAANVQPDGVIAVDDVKTMWFKPDELSSLNLRKGDVVVVEGGVGGYGRAAFVSESLDGWGFQNSVNRIRPFGDGRFIAYYLQAVRAKGFTTAYCNVVSMPHLTAEKLAAMPISIPPSEEQSRICDHLDAQTSRIDALIAESEDLITLSEERRAALITAAVTGQIDVREAS